MVLNRPVLWKLFVFPLISALLITLGVMWGNDTIFLSHSGEKIDAKIAGMLKILDDKADLITSADYEVTVSFADNNRGVATLRERNVVYAKFNNQEFDKSRLVSLADSKSETNPPHLKNLISLAEKASSSDLGALERLLRQSQTKDVSERIKSLTLKEHIKVLKDIPLPIKSITMKNGQLIQVATAQKVIDSFTLIPFTLSATLTQLDKENDAKRIDELKRDIVISFSEFDGSQYKPVDHTKTNFSFFTKSYWYIYRPVYSYKVDGTEHTALSRFAKRHSPSSDLELGDNVTIAYDKKNPSRSTIPPSSGGLGKESNFLERYNAAAATLLGRWFIPGLLFIFGAVAGAIGITLITMYLNPGEDKGSSDDVVD